MHRIARWKLNYSLCLGSDIVDKLNPKLIDANFDANEVHDENGDKDVDENDNCDNEND